MESQSAYDLVSTDMWYKEANMIKWVLPHPHTNPSVIMKMTVGDRAAIHKKGNSQLKRLQPVAGIWLRRPFLGNGKQEVLSDLQVSINTIKLN